MKRAGTLVAVMTLVLTGCRDECNTSRQALLAVWGEAIVELDRAEVEAIERAADASDRAAADCNAGDCSASSRAQAAMERGQAELDASDVRAARSEVQSLQEALVRSDLERVEQALENLTHESRRTTAVSLTSAGVDATRRALERCGRAR
jgi:hypothetical protein